MTVKQGWHLAQAWYADRLAEGWRRHTPEEAQKVFDEVGLMGPFWQLT